MTAQKNKNTRHQSRATQKNTESIYYKKSRPWSWMETLHRCCSTRSGISDRRRIESGLLKQFFIFYFVHYYKVMIYISILYNNTLELHVLHTSVFSRTASVICTISYIIYYLWIQCWFRNSSFIAGELKTFINIIQMTDAQCDANEDSLFLYKK